MHSKLVAYRYYTHAITLFDVAKPSRYGASVCLVCHELRARYICELTKYFKTV